MYNIDGVEVKLKEDMTLAELDEVNKLISPESGLDNSSIAKLIELVVVPVSAPFSVIDGSKATEKTATQIISDFFLERKKAQANMLKHFSELTQELKS